MADQDNREVETTEEVESTTEETKQVSQIEDNTHQSELEDEGRKGTIARIADILRGRKAAVKKEESTEDNTDTEETQTETEENTEAAADEGEVSEEGKKSADEYDEIDPRFVAVARKYGWSDDRIVSYAEGHDDRDVVMLTGMMEKDTPSVTQEVVPVKEEPSDVQKFLDQLETSEDVGDPVKQVLRSLVTDLKNTKAQLKSVTDTQKDVDKSHVQNEWVGRAREADEQFDSVSKEFTELGTFKNLKRLPDGSLNPNDPAVKNREELFKMAVTLFKSGASWNSAVKDSIRWYKGGREDVVEGKVLQKIKANSKRLSPKRETRQHTRKFANEQEEKASIINTALSKYGVELPE